MSLTSPNIALNTFRFHDNQNSHNPRVLEFGPMLCTSPAKSSRKRKIDEDPSSSNAESSKRTKTLGNKLLKMPGNITSQDTEKADQIYCLNNKQISKLIIDNNLSVLAEKISECLKKIQDKTKNESPDETELFDMQGDYEAVLEQGRRFLDAAGSESLGEIGRNFFWDQKIASSFFNIINYRKQLFNAVLSKMGFDVEQLNVKQIESLLKERLNEKSRFLLDAYIDYWIEHIYKYKDTDLSGLPQDDLDKLVSDISKAYTFMVSKKREIGENKFENFWNSDFEIVFEFIEKCRASLARINNMDISGYDCEQKKQPTRAILDSIFLWTREIICNCRELNVSEEETELTELFVNTISKMHKIMLGNIQKFHKGGNILWDNDIQITRTFLDRYKKIIASSDSSSSSSCCDVEEP